MRVERLPFTVYDVVGYFMPGMLLIGYVLISVHADRLTLFSFLFASAGASVLSSVVLGVFLLIIAYAVGHIAAWLSSETLEKLFIWFVGYPSAFLAREDAYASTTQGPYLTNELRRICWTNFKKKWKSNYFYCFLLFILFFPHVFLLCVICFVGGLRHLIKPLEALTLRLLKGKFSKVFVEPKEGIEGRDWFILVEYYTSGKFNVAAMRMYNYLTIYGFCRNISFVMYIGFCLGCYRLAEFGVTAHELVFVISNLMGSYFMLLSFLKFFRRYSQEAIINFVVLEKEDAGDK